MHAFLVFIYIQDDWNPDWQSTSSSKVAYLVEKLKVLEEDNREISSAMIKDNAVKHIEELFWPSQMCNSNTLSRPSVDSQKALLKKVIVFSQFLEHIHVIEQQVAKFIIHWACLFSVCFMQK